MPNWTENRIRMKKENLEKLFTLNEDGKYSLDFNKLIPMPKEVDTKPDLEGDCIACYYLSLNAQEQEKLKKDFGERYCDRFLYDKSLEFYRYWYSEKMPEKFVEFAEKGAMYASNIRKYGHPCRYYWCTANWGTDRNVGDDVWIGCSDKDGNVNVAFDTAWEAPTGIIKKYAEMCTDDEFNWLFIDEQAPDALHFLTKNGNEILDSVCYLNPIGLPIDN